VTPILLQAQCGPLEQAPSLLSHAALLPPGGQVRSQGLSFYNPFADAPPPDRDILLDLLRAGEPSVALAPGWETAVAQGLTDRGAVRLTAAPADRAALKQTLLQLAASTSGCSCSPHSAGGRTFSRFPNCPISCACAGPRRSPSLLRAVREYLASRVQSHSVVTQLCAQLHGWIDFVALAE